MKQFNFTNIYRTIITKVIPSLNGILFTIRIESQCCLLVLEINERNILFIKVMNKK